MAHPVKKTYRDNSPGGRRLQVRITLSHIKKEIKANARSRKQFREQGLLG